MITTIYIDEHTPLNQIDMLATAFDATGVEYEISTRAGHYATVGISAPDDVFYETFLPLLAGAS